MIERHLVAPLSGKVAVNGHTVTVINGGPTSLFDLIGRERVLMRLDKALAYIDALV